MAERLIIPPVSIPIDNGRAFLLDTREEREEVKRRIMDKLGVKLGEWKLTPKRWRHGGGTFYGLFVERKL